MIFDKWIRSLNPILRIVDLSLRLTASLRFADAQRVRKTMIIYDVKHVKSHYDGRFLTFSKRTHLSSAKRSEAVSRRLNWTIRRIGFSERLIIIVRQMMLIYEVKQIKLLYDISFLIFDKWICSLNPILRIVHLSLRLTASLRFADTQRVRQTMIIYDVKHVKS